MKDRTNLFVKKPIGFLNKKVNFDFKNLFFELSKSVISFKMGNPLSGVKGLIDTLKSVSLEKDSEGEIAYQLILTALINAANELVEEHTYRLKSAFDNVEKLYDEPEYVAFLEEITTVLDNKELSISAAQLKSPRSLSIVDEFQPFFQKWLLQFGLTKEAATPLVNRFPTYFVFAFVDEWQGNPSRYRVIDDYLNTPASAAAEREKQWNRYKQWLQKQAEDSVFDELFSLKEIYVPLRAYYYEKANKKETEEDKIVVASARHESRGERHKIPIDLMSELNKWAENTSKHSKANAIKLLSGGPGSGKSSFAKIWAANLAEKGHRVAFIPLHHFNVKDDLLQGIGDFFKIHPYLQHNPLEHLSECKQPLLLILDGLDELSKQGVYAAEVASKFVHEVERSVQSINQEKCQLKVLITGREVAVQAHELTFRKQKQILYLLPYFLTENAIEGFSKNKKLLQTDQRNIWWQKFAQFDTELKGKGILALPKELQNPKLDEITAQPLLNYLVALSVQRGKIQFDENTNLNEIYEDLVKGVYERGYEGENRHHRSIAQLTFKDFIRILEEIAVAAWHGGDVRTTTVKKIEAHIERSRIQRIFEKFQEDAKKGVTRLLTAFYFREHGIDETSGDKTFEFTHKSFGEYLTARRLVNQIQVIHQNLQLHQEDFDTGYDAKTALQKWLHLTGETAVTEYLFSFLQDEVKQQSIDLLKEWQQTLIELINYTLAKGLPFEGERKSHKEECRLARNSEEALLVLLNVCARQTKVVSDIEWGTNNAFGTWLRKLQPERNKGGSTLSYKCLSWINAIGQEYYFGDLFHANLENSNLSNSRLNISNMIRADLHNVILKNAHMPGVNLSNARLFFANFTGTYMHNSNLNNAILYNTNLTDTDLSHSSLKGIHMRNVNMKNANFA